MICTSCAEPNAEAAELYLRNVSSRISACKTFALPSWYLVALTRQAGDPTTLRSDSHSLPTNGVLSNINRTNPPNAKYPQCLQHKWSEPFHSSPCCRHADHLQSPGYRRCFRLPCSGTVLGSTSPSLEHLIKRRFQFISHR